MTHPLLAAWPHVSAYRFRPMTGDEIDAHPDCGRLWATLMDIQRDEDDAVEIELLRGKLEDAEENLAGAEDELRAIQKIATRALDDEMHERDALTEILELAGG